MKTLKEEFDANVKEVVKRADGIRVLDIDDVDIDIGVRIGPREDGRYQEEDFIRAEIHSRIKFYWTEIRESAALCILDTTGLSCDELKEYALPIVAMLNELTSLTVLTLLTQTLGETMMKRIMKLIRFRSFRERFLKCQKKGVCTDLMAFLPGANVSHVLLCRRYVCQCGSRPCKRERTGVSGLLLTVWKNILAKMSGQPTVW